MIQNGQASPTSPPSVEGSSREAEGSRRQSRRLGAIRAPKRLGHHRKSLLLFTYGPPLSLPPAQTPLYFPDGGDIYLEEFAKTGEKALPLTNHAFEFARKSGKTPISVFDNWKLNYEREKYRRDHAAVMKEHGVDFILCPAYVGAGVLQGGAKYWNYTAIWNILDLPSSVLPSGLKCVKDVDVRDEAYKTRGEQDEEEWKACKLTRPPLSIQTGNFYLTLVLQMIRSCSTTFPSRCKSLGNGTGTKKCWQ